GRRGGDLDVGIYSVVLDPEARGVEGEGVARLRDRRAVDEGVTAVDPDDATPRTYPDDRPQADLLDRGVDDIAVGAAVFVGDQDDGPPRRLARVGHGRRIVAPRGPRDDPRDEPGQHEFGG